MLCTCPKLFYLQEAFYTPYREVVVGGVKKKFTPTGYIEERLKTLRKKEPLMHKKHTPRKVFKLDVTSSAASVDESKAAG